MKPIELWQGDCLELMKNIPDGSVDLVLTDPPYGTVKNLENIMCAVEKAAELKRKSVIQYDLDGKFLAVWNSTREAERVLGIYHSHIAKCCNKVPKYNTAGGYRWEYADK